MEQLPNTAKARLAALRPGPHPDAEQLNAFSENALGASERETVLAHLAACVDCRDIVGLAASARPAGAPIAKPARGGFRWATFQWAAVAASVGIVMVAVLVVGPHKPQTDERASEVAPARQPIAEPAMPVPDASAEGSKNVADARAKAKLDRDASSKITTKTAPGFAIGSVSGGGFGGGVYRVEPKQAPASNDELAKSADKKKESALSDAAAPARESQVNAPVPQPVDSYAGGRVAAQTGGPSSAPALKTGAQPPAPMADGERAAAVGSNARNEVSKDQQVASTSAATTSQSVELAAAASGKGHFSMNAGAAKSAPVASTGGIVSTRLDSTPLMWRVVTSELQSSADAGKTWQNRKPAPGVMWTAVAALGQQVCAGGKAGALYVSRDNGKTWKKFLLAGIPPGDVLKIEMNGQAVNVLLSNGDDWDSNDGGESFHQLPHP